MQSPTSQTPIARCLALGAYAGQMLGKFPDNPLLVDLSQRMFLGVSTLRAAEQEVVTKQDALLLARVDLGYADYDSDQATRSSKKRAEIADGAPRGHIVSRVFPGGIADITRRFGESQIVAMRTIETRIANARSIWPDAEQELTRLQGSRERYEVALAARNQARQDLRDARTNRNAAREHFIDLYAEISSLVKAEFPRNRVLQDLFFDRVRARPAAADEFSTDPIESGDDDTGSDDDLDQTV